MFDKLKFWKRHDDFSDMGTLSDDPFSSGTDPLSKPDPLANATPGVDTDPMQTSFPDMGSGSSSPTGGMQHPQPSAYQATSPVSQVPTPESYQDYPEGRDRDMELVIAKLDSIKSELDSLHQRVRRIEQHSEKPRTVW